MHVFIFSFEKNHCPSTVQKPAFLRHAPACMTVASCDAWPAGASPSVAAPRRRTGAMKGMGCGPTLAAWLHHNGAGTSGANWLHYNYWVSTFKGCYTIIIMAHSLILPVHSGEVRVDHDANISRKVPLWPVCVGGPRGKKWSWVDPSLSIVLGGLE